MKFCSPFCTQTALSNGVDGLAVERSVDLPVRHLNEQALALLLFHITSALEYLHKEKITFEKELAVI